MVFVFGAEDAQLLAGDSGAGTFSVSAANLTTEIASAGQVVIGRAADGSGAVDINPVNTSGESFDLTVVGGSVDVDGLNAGGNDVDLVARNGGTINDGSTGTDVTSAAVSFDGNVSPGQSPGILNVAGNFTFAAGDTFTVDIGGTLPGNNPTNHDHPVRLRALFA